MENAIVTKINLEIKEGILKESQVHYLMVELRKLLDRLKVITGNDYRLIRFYSDWVVHIEKDRITKEIKEVMRRIDQEIPMDCHTNKSWQIDNREHIKFIYMQLLIKEMKELFLKEGINSTLLDNKEQRINFISLLVKILEDQPINNPISSIKSFYFEPSNVRCAIWIIEFNDTRGLCRFGNAY